MILLLVSLLVGLTYAAPLPEQIHLAITGNADEMNIAWVTFEDAPTSLQYGLKASSLLHVRTGTTYAWTFGNITRYNHNITLTGLQPDTRYYYEVHDSTTIYSFKTFPVDPSGIRICIFGDLGLKGVDFKGEGQSIQSLLKESQDDKFDMVIHVGDIAYDLHSDQGRNGDAYMNTLEPMIATKPYMVIVGNHEDDSFNFSNYKNRFHMPKGSRDAMFYSFDLGPIHFVGINTESYGYYYSYGMEPVFTQYNWLIDDLENVDRSKTPWLISYQHRPFYCTNENSGECTAFENRLIRDGYLNMPGLEPLFLKYGMDIGFWGHAHSYERFYPIAKKMYFNDQDPYHNAAAPIYIITGSAGCNSGNAKFVNPSRPFSAKRVNDYGYSIMTLKNRTHIYVEQISIEKDNAVVDSVMISKDLNHEHNIKRRSNSLNGRPFPESNFRFTGCVPKDAGCLNQLRRMNREL